MCVIHGTAEPPISLCFYSSAPQQRALGSTNPSRAPRAKHENVAQPGGSRVSREFRPFLSWQPVGFVTTRWAWHGTCDGMARCVLACRARNHAVPHDSAPIEPSQKRAEPALSERKSTAEWCHVHIDELSERWL